METRPNSGSEGDLGEIADVFGISINEPAAAEPATPATPEPAAPASSEPAPGSVTEPSVGTEGGAGQEQETAPAPAPSPTPAGGEGSATPEPQQPAVPPVQTPPQQQTSDPRDLQIASLTAQLQALKATVEASAPAGAAGQPGAEPAKPAAPEIIPVQLPKQLVETIFGEDFDQAHNGLNVLISTVASGLQARFQQQLAAAKTEMQDQIKSLRQADTQVDEQKNAETQRQEYFTRFPDHNKPILQPLLGQALSELVAEFPGVPWNDQFMNALGARVNAKLQESGVSFGTQPAPVVAAPAKPAAMLPQGSRPAPAAADANEIADVWAVG